MNKMTTRHERLLALALRLSPEERAFVADKLWDSLESELESGDLTDEQKAELDRRLAEMEADPDAGIPWEEVRARLRQER